MVLPVVVYLLQRGARGRQEHRALACSEIATVAAAGSKDLDAAALLLTTQDQVERTVAGVANYGGSLDVIVDDAEESDDRRRRRADRRGVLLIVLALVYYLVSTIVALRQITAGLDEVIAGVGEIVEKSAPVNDVVNAINAQLDAGVDLLEGLLVKKAGLSDAVGLIDGLYPGAAAAGLRNFPESTEVEAPRIGEVYTKGTLTLARLGREAPIAAASPAGEVLRNVEGGSLAARQLYPSVRHDEPGEPAALAGHRHRRPRPVRAARRHRGAAQAAARPVVPDRKEPSCRPLRHSSTSARPASRARSRRSSGSAPRRGSSPAATACCR